MSRTLGVITRVVFALFVVGCGGALVALAFTEDRQASGNMLSGILILAYGGANIYLLHRHLQSFGPSRDEP